MFESSVGSIAFNDGWIVRKPMGPFAAVMGGPAEELAVTLPHDSLRDAQRTPDAPSGSGSGYFPSGAWTYVKTFDAPAEWQDKRVVLEFDGVASNALVYLNEALVGQRPYTYARFNVDLTDYLRPGHSNQIRVEVRVHKDSRWYTGAGIYRQVNLLVSERTHLVADSLQVQTKSIEGRLAELSISAEVATTAGQATSSRIELEIIDASGAVVATRNLPVVAKAGAVSKVSAQFTLEAAALWSIDAPNLYRATAKLVDESKTLDVASTKFGIRTVQVDAKRGLRVNGQTVKLRGACIHVDNGLLGAISLPAAERRKVQKLKEAGFNAVRISHNPASQAFLNACDEIGLFVMNEAFDTWTIEKSEFDQTRNFLEWWERDIESLVFGSRNHPSVVLYSIGNEIPELGSDAGRIWNRRIANKVRSLDLSRPVTNGINTMLAIDMSELIQKAGGLNQFMGADGDMSGTFNKIAVTPEVSNAIEEVASALDVVGYNYAQGRYAIDAADHPDRVLVGSETFANDIAENWALVEKFDHVIGDFTWTGWDYLGEVGIGSVAYKEDESFTGGLGREYPFVLAYCGDIDITGYRRPASYYREIVYGLRAEPFIAVQHPARFEHTLVSSPPWAWSDVVEGWSWSGFEGKPIRVEVYADADEVELWLNGQQVATAAVGAKKAFVASFETHYAAGELVAVAKRGGVEVSRTALKSAGQPQLSVSTDKSALAADGQDIAHLEISLRDANGVLFNLADDEITVSVSGAGVLAGLGSSNPSTETRFDSSVVSAFDGRALAIVRATGAGEISVTVSTAAHGSKTISIIAA
jgi:beta-galactosidase